MPPASHLRVVAPSSFKFDRLIHSGVIEGRSPDLTGGQRGGAVAHTAIKRRCKIGAVDLPFRCVADDGLKLVDNTAKPGTSDVAARRCRTHDRTDAAGQITNNIATNNIYTVGCRARRGCEQSTNQKNNTTTHNTKSPRGGQGEISYSILLTFRPKGSVRWQRRLLSGSRRHRDHSSSIG